MSKTTGTASKKLVKAPRRSRIDWAGANSACEALAPGSETLVRDMVTRMVEKWTLWTASP